MSGENFVRPPAVAGLFYPADKDTLKKTVDDFLVAAGKITEQEKDSNIVAMICPHAGYQYSGPTAGHAYAAVRGKSFGTVVIVSPSHREYFDGISVFSGNGYSTPLGTISIDTDLRDALCNVGEGLIEKSKIGHRNEHAIEVQLPFLQVAIGEFKLLPIVMGEQKPQYCFSLGHFLADVLKNTNSLIIASSDLSHYHDYQSANELDAICRDDIVRGSADDFMRDIESGNCEACGAGPIAAVMVASKLLGADKWKILHHCNSGDTGGDKFAVVGYLAAIARGKK
ncbi:MAG: AmmeMemoRadiSam system protein B [Candidatus Kryptoniota bacterium]